MARVKSGKRHPPFGATKKQAERYAVERDLRNQILELTNRLAGIEDMAYQRGVADGKATLNLSDHTMKALRAVCDVPMRRVFAMKLLNEWQVLIMVVENLELMHSLKKHHIATDSVSVDIKHGGKSVSHGEWNAQALRDALAVNSPMISGIVVDSGK